MRADASGEGRRDTAMVEIKSGVSNSGFGFGRLRLTLLNILYRARVGTLQFLGAGEFLPGKGKASCRLAPIFLAL